MVNKYIRYREAQYKFYLKFFKARKILDVGSSDSVSRKIGRKLGKEVTCVDPFPKSDDVVQAFSWSLPFKDGSFDGVLFSHVIEHIPIIADNFLVKETFKEFYRVLRDKGELVVITPHISTIKHKFWDDPTHIRPYTFESLCSLGSKTGFRVKRKLTGFRYFYALPFIFYKLNLLDLWYQTSPYLSRILPFGYKEVIVIFEKV